MTLSVPAPMLAKAQPQIPDPDSIAGGYSYEPKWDGFRVLVSFDGSDVELVSRGAKPLTRYFPELIEALSAQLSEPCIIDGEIVVPVTTDGHTRLDWEALSARIHPAQSRIAQLSKSTPASLVAFDLIHQGDEDLTTLPFSQRRERLTALFASLTPPLYVTQATTDPQVARDWLDRFEGAGLDGVVAKAQLSPYSPGKRTMIKIKHARTADVVVLGYRVHSSGSGVGSLLVGLYDDAGNLHQVGGISAFTAKRRLELIDELDDLVIRDDDGSAARGEGERGRFTGSKDVSFVRLRPERVVEVRYDQLEGRRFRHTVQFERWRPDRDAHSCTYDQLDQVAAYDLADVLVASPRS